MAERPTFNPPCEGRPLFILLKAFFVLKLLYLVKGEERKPFNFDLKHNGRRGIL